MSFSFQVCREFLVSRAGIGTERKEHESRIDAGMSASSSAPAAPENTTLLYDDKDFDEHLGHKTTSSLKKSHMNELVPQKGGKHQALDEDDYAEQSCVIRLL